MRVYEYARKYGKTSKEIISLCHELGIEVKAAQSVLKDDALVALTSRFGSGKDSEVVLEQLTLEATISVNEEEVVKVNEEKAVEAPLNQFVYVVTECHPFTNIGELGKSASTFAQETMKNGDRAIVIIPQYACISEEYVSKMEQVYSTVIKVGWREQIANINKLVQDEVIYYFVQNDDYFNRENIYGYDDDAERFAFFNRAILETLPVLELAVQKIYVNDWHTSLLPLLLTVDYKEQAFYQSVETVLNIHNLEYQGWYDVNVLPDVLGVSTEYFDNGLTRMGDAVNFLKSGIVTAHQISINDVIREQLELPEMINSGMSGVVRSKLSA